MNDEQDIVNVLRALASMSDELTPEDVAKVLNHAAELIETLQKLVAVRERIAANFEAAPTEGSA